MDIGLIVKNVRSQNKNICVPAVKLIGNICTGPDEYVDKVISNEALKAFLTLLNSAEIDPRILKETCWALSNITAGPSKHIQSVIDSGLIETLSQLAISNQSFMVSREATWALCNAVTNANSYQMWIMIEKCALLALVARLDCTDLELTRLILSSIGRVLKSGENADNKNSIAVHFESIGGLKKLSSMQYNPNIEIYDMVTKIMKRYFEVSEIAEEES